MVKICFVCLGNICRSPTAEGVMRHLIEGEGLSHAIEIDSAGTAAYHAGESPDARSTAHAARRGVRLEGRARQFVAADWQRFDLVLAMDQSNYEDLERQAPGEYVKRLRLFRSFDPSSKPNASVPDPYYGGDRGFEEVLDLCEAACLGLIEHLRQHHGLR